MSNSQWFCIRLDLLGLFIINEVFLSVLGLGGDAKGIEVISCIKTFLLNYWILFFPIMCSRHWFDIKYIQATLCGFCIQTPPLGPVGA